MKTETLIELQRSITQGEWIASKDFALKADPRGLAIYTSQYNTKVCCVESWFTYKLELSPLHDECKHNATAIALVPELIAEVIKLREAARLCFALCEEIEATETNAYAQARAALANDK